MESKAIARTVRITPRKARLVIDLIRGVDVKEAQAILQYTPRAASPIILKVLNSAIANADHNYSMDTNKLYVKDAYVNEGVRMKRMLPRAKGQGDIIQKRTSHITVVVAERN
ncbi:MAG: 50S ribosomal protein L22 [Paracholeplasma sp.]|jgi:large subunit ribosomal protein L22|uniref:Large ribosomal subunit protein uL22 n=1 Tax=Acholeplasma brassicae TaxID=61635 RepID=U4KMG5_9MOLU|nr:MULTISPECIES: 50S ribosomal protein L22 [Paracholeplasma]MDY3196085.1 50S ribosomal protein L22 [Paracholeplasma sp.]CCV65261.1 50S ribosomal protein L22 [Paracholeplasma brassicae]HBT59360.1 50S ribosomal protein L22 [Acholeplasmataceae bacterium]